jgi:hypothetical protein
MDKGFQNILRKSNSAKRQPRFEDTAICRDIKGATYEVREVVPIRADTPT